MDEYKATHKISSVSIPTDIIDSPLLSWGAKGLLAYVISCTSDTTIDLSDIMLHSYDKCTDVKSFICELLECGHIESNKKTQNLKGKTKSATRKTPLHEIEMTKEWKAFVDMRISIRAKMTEHAKELAINKLERLAPGNIEMQRQILNQSTELSYRGLFPLKSQQVQHQTQQRRILD